MDVALAQSGLSAGDAILACLDDPQFRAQLERISAERLAAAEHKLVDWLWRRLSGPDEGMEKSVVAIWQSLSDEKRRTTSRPEVPAAPPARKARRGIPAGHAEAARKTRQEAEDFHRLLEVIRTRLAAAEKTNPDG
jgi:hypothetical protein